MAANKTAALVLASCVMGGLAVGAGTDQLEVLRRFGHHIGLAFQLVDDVLGIWGDPGVTGKPVGADLVRHKKTFPVLAAIGSGTSAGDQLAELYRSGGVNEANLTWVAGLVADAGGRDWGESEASQQRRLAVRSLPEPSSMFC